MDFACGTGNMFSMKFTVLCDKLTPIGLISRELAPYTKKIVGVDITQAFVDNYNKRVADQGIPTDEICAVCTELKGEEGELDGLKFDVIVVRIWIFDTCLQFIHVDDHSVFSVLPSFPFCRRHHQEACFLPEAWRIPPRHRYSGP